MEDAAKSANSEIGKMLYIKIKKTIKIVHITFVILSPLEDNIVILMFDSSKYIIFMILI